MKKAAAVFSILAVIITGLTLWGFSGARLELRVDSVHALAEEEYQARFSRLREQLNNGAVRGIVYEEQLDGDASDYVILEYTILVTNRGLLDAQMLEAAVVPVRGDVLCFSQQEAQGLDVNSSIEAGAGKQMRLRCYLLTRKDLHAVRDIQVSYYVWGNPFILKVQYG